MVVQNKLLALQTQADFLGQFGMGGHGSLHHRVEKTRSVASRGFGLVHGHIGLFEQVVHALVVLHEHHNTNAGGAVVLVLAQVVGVCQGVQYLVCHQFGLGGGLAGLLAQSFKQHHKLISAQARHAVTFAHTVAQARGDLLEQLITYIVAQGVIQELEVVKIQEHQRAMLLQPCRIGHGVAHAVHQKAAVGQAGQGVVKRQSADFFFVLALLCDVAQ